MYEYFNNLKEINDDDIKILVIVYGYNNVIEFFNNIKCNFEMLVKLKKYWETRVNDELFISELLALDNGCLDNNCHYLENPIKEIDVSSSLLAYYQEMLRYPILSNEQEKQCFNDLNLRDNITILKKYKYGSLVLELPNLPLIFSSITNLSQAKLVISMLRMICTSKEKLQDRIIDYYVGKYEKLINSLGDIPKYDELCNLFSLDSEYDVFKKNDLSNHIDVVYLFSQLRDYLKVNRSFEVLVNSNLRLVLSVVKKYNCTSDLLDIINVGNLGLIEAIKRFDLTKGCKFSTYAIYWIRNYVSRYLLSTVSELSITREFAKEILDFKTSLHMLKVKHKRSLSVNEIALELGMSVSKVLELLTSCFKVRSLDEAIGSDWEETYGCFVVGDDDIESEICYKLLKDDISVLFANLKPREIEIIKLRYGIGTIDGEGLTLREISIRLNISKERVRQIENVTLEKLRGRVKKNIKVRELGDYLS